MSVPRVSSVSWNDEIILNDSAAPERSIVCRQRLTRGNLGFISPFVRSPAINDLSIRTMRPDEISIAVNWAAAEGWNPGLADDACFAAVDPEGFLIGELDGAPAATVSCVNYGASFAFLGFYIVREDLRGRGYGLRIWNAAIAHAGPRVIGLDGVVAQQQNYRKSGFELAYANVRYSGTVAAPDAPQAGVIALAEVPLAAVEAYDATVFPAPRPAFLRAWIGSPGHVGCALMRDGGLVGWGVIRPCRGGLIVFVAGRGGGGGHLPRRSQHQPRRGRVGARPGARASVRDCAHVYRRDPAVAAGTGVGGHPLL